MASTHGGGCGGGAVGGVGTGTIAFLRVLPVSVTNSHAPLKPSGVVVILAPAARPSPPSTPNPISSLVVFTLVSPKFAPIFPPSVPVGCPPKVTAASGLRVTIGCSAVALKPDLGPPPEVSVPALYSTD